MPVTQLLSFALEVPAAAPGAAFYKKAGLKEKADGALVRLHCPDQQRESVLLLETGRSKRLHHIKMAAEDLPAIERTAVAAGGRIIDAPDGLSDDGLWICDPLGLRIHLVDTTQMHAAVAPSPEFRINGPGRIARKRLSAVRPVAAYPVTRPLKLGHVMLFTPDVLASVAFMVDGLDVGLADRAQDVVAFCCCRMNSDHHVVAFAKSAGLGFHHASFEVSDPDEVGRAGRRLVDKTGASDWGYGRHTIGSNFFHYIQDPWGSWIEYYSDMDHIDDYSLWAPTNYALEDSLANWAPPLPHDFVHNYEADGEFSR